MRNLYLLQKTSILDDRFESCSCAKIVPKIVPTLYRPLGYSFCETDQLSTVVVVRQWWYSYWSRCKLLLLIIRWKLVVPQTGFNYSLVGMRKIDSTLKFNEPSESLVNLHSLIVCSSLCVSSKLTPNLLWLVWTFTASEPDISSRTLS